MALGYVKKRQDMGTYQGSTCGDQILSINFVSKCQLCIIYIKMGKKLRTRQLLSDTDSETDNNDTSLPILLIISPSTIRKTLRSKLSSKFTHESKTNKFKAAISSKEMSEFLPSNLFECPICLELLVNPMMMSCGHVYCFRCLESNAAYNEKCCLCRNQQGEEPYIPIKMTESLIERFLLQSGPELVRYLCRTTDSSQWAKRRKISNWRQGLVVDYRDRSQVWRRGVLIKVEDANTVEVRFNIKGMDFIERVEKSSRRIAPFTFFTRNRYLQDFPSLLPQYDRTQKEFSKLEFQAQMDQGDFFFPEPQQAGQVSMQEHYQDEALRIFNSEMQDLDPLFSF